MCYLPVSYVSILDLNTSLLLYLEGPRVLESPRVGPRVLES